MLETGRETSKAFLNLKEKGYAEKYLGEAREICLIGIDFDPDLRNISNFLWEREK